jgi:hypothetical protein
MCTVLVSYNPKNRAANNLMYALSKTRGVKIDDDAIFTDEEMMRIDEARKSGYASLDDLKKLLRQ